MTKDDSRRAADPAPRAAEQEGRGTPATPGPRGARRDRRPRRRRLPAVVWALTALWGGLLLGATLLWPMTYGYDEGAQLDMSHIYSEQPFHFYDPATLGLSNGLKKATNLQPGYPPRTPLAQSPIRDRADRQTWDEFGGATLTTAYPPNQMIQHPPLYFWVEAAVLRVPGVAGLSWDLQSWLLRLASVVMVLPVPALCFATTRRLLRGGGPIAGGPPERSERVALLAALVPFSLANLVRDGASVNNDNLLILSSSVMLYGLARVVTGDLSRRVGGVVAVGLAVALMTKGFALVFPPFILAAYLIGSWRRGQGLPSWGRRLLPGLLVAALGGVVGSWWWVRNLLVYGVVQTNGAGAQFENTTYGVKDYKGSFTTFLPHYLELFAVRTWGGIGLPESPELAPVLVWGWLGVVLVGIVAVLVRRGRGGRRVWAWLLALLLVATIAVPAAGSWASNQQWSKVYPGTSGRYVYHLVVAIAALAAVGWAGVLRRQAARTLAPWLLAAGLVTQVTAWSAILLSWYAPLGSDGPRGVRTGLQSLSRWSPTSSTVTYGLVVLVPLATAVVAFVLVLRASRAGGDDDTGRSSVTAEEGVVPSQEGPRVATA